MKKLLCYTLSLIIIFGCFGVYAEDNITVKINDVNIAFDVMPQLVNGRTMVPVRAIFEALDATVVWDEATRGIISVKDDTTIIMHLDDPVMKVNDKVIILDVPPFETEGRTLVPVRAISEAFSCKVLWEDATQTVLIQTENEYTSKEIAEIASPAVFFIYVLDENYEVFGTGSGFFISEDGIAVSNFHVVEGAAHVVGEMTDGTFVYLDKILYADKDNDFVIFTVVSDERTQFPYLELGDSDKLAAGQKAYAIGSPKGLDNTISDGLISNPYRYIDDIRYIQISVPISHGSSGGALLNEQGQVIGITSAGRDDGQNLNFAMPINLVRDAQYYPVPIGLEDLPVDFININLSEEHVSIFAGDAASIIISLGTNLDSVVLSCESTDSDIADAAFGEDLSETACYLNIGGFSQGTAAILIYANDEFTGKYIIVDVYEKGVPTYMYSNIITYTHITGVKCRASVDTKTDDSKSGYEPTYDAFFYNYDFEHFTFYCDYLKSKGFEQTDATINGTYRIYTYESLFDGLVFSIDAEENTLLILTNARR